jgi:FMN phosphatase YigB (HAD superfamily)
METPNLQDIRVVGFDLDQTLYPKSPVIDELIQAYLYKKISEHRDVSLEEAERLFKDRYQSGAGMSGSQTLKDLGVPNASELVQEALEHADLTSVLAPDLETNQFLADLRNTYEGLDLITGSNLEQTMKKLAVLDMRTDMFSHVITADDSAKSNGDSYRAWLALYPHLKPSQFLYVGDRARSDHDVPSALGIRTCLVYVTSPNPGVTALQLTDLKELRKMFPLNK